MIADPSEDPSGKPTYVVESFNIAVYLDDKYPAPKHPAVFAPDTRAVQLVTSNFFTNEVGYSLLPALRRLQARPGFLDDRGREYFLRTREKILANTLPISETGVGSKLWGEIHDKWEEFGKVLDLNEGGPFVTGEKKSFTDFAIGGIIHSVRRVEGGEMLMWKDMAEWQGGRWARIWVEIEKLERDSTEVV